MLTKTTIKAVLIFGSMLLLIPVIFAFLLWCYFVGVYALSFSN